MGGVHARDYMTIKIPALMTKARWRPTGSNVRPARPRTCRPQLPKQMLRGGYGVAEFFARGVPLMTPPPELVPLRMTPLLLAQFVAASPPPAAVLRSIV